MNVHDEGHDGKSFHQINKNAVKMSLHFQIELHFHWCGQKKKVKKGKSVVAL